MEKSPLLKQSYTLTPTHRDAVCAMNRAVAVRELLVIKLPIRPLLLPGSPFHLPRGGLISCTYLHNRPLGEMERCSWPRAAMPRGARLTLAQAPSSPIRSMIALVPRRPARVLTRLLGVSDDWALGARGREQTRARPQQF
jgi:hypothetical protein